MSVPEQLQELLDAAKETVTLSNISMPTWPARDAIGKLEVLAPSLARTVLTLTEALKRIATIYEAVDLHGEMQKLDALHNISEIADAALKLPELERAMEEMDG